MATPLTWPRLATWQERREDREVERELLAHLSQLALAEMSKEFGVTSRAQVEPDLGRE